MGKHLGDFIALKRACANLTQTQVADELGFMSPQFVSNIERGIAPIPPAHVKALAKLLKTSTNSLLYEIFEDIKLDYMKAVYA